MADPKVPAEYRNPAAVYRLPSQPLQVSYRAADCTASAKSDNPGFQCGNTFLKVHGGKRFLLVPQGNAVGPLLFAVIDKDGKRTVLPPPKMEVLMSPIDSDFVDVHGGDGDCR